MEIEADSPVSVNWFFLAALNHGLACSRAAELSRHLTRLDSNERDEARRRERAPRNNCADDARKWYAR